MSGRSNSNTGSVRRGPCREQKKFIDYEARVTRNGFSGNHLLNFSMPERERNVNRHHRKKRAAAPRTQIEYLHANYRFVIAPLDPNIAVPIWDLEALAEWSSVEQVLLWYDIESPQTCPICMDTFRAPKITNWPCILRYLSLTEKYWRRCPMCFDPVQKGHLRSVQLQQLQLPPRVGSSVTFQFLERFKSSMFPQLRVLPSLEIKSEHAELDGSSLHITSATAFAACKRSRKLPNVNDADAIYSRILEATPDYLRELLRSELRDLQSMDAEFRSSGDLDNLPFVNDAIRNITGRLSQSDDFSRGTYGFSSSTIVGGKSQKPQEDSSGDTYSFYQIADGTYVILHPLNMKCLLKEFANQKQDEDMHDKDLETTRTVIGSVLANSKSLSFDRYHLVPEQIHGRVLDIEHVVMDEEARKRYRFLSHLPRFCDFYICEIDLTSLLSLSTLSAFQNELKKRAKQRKLKFKQQNAPASSSPVFKRNADAFSLEQDGLHWPLPYEQAVAESLEELQLNNASTGEFDVTHQNDERSFAQIMDNSGGIPALGEETLSDPRTEPVSFGASSAWGSSTSSSLPLSAWSSGKGGKKKGSGKKGVAVFSTTQRRSYR
ncbi:hypothetical protein CCR75_005946 [Bremia lactucae]|uniref:RING-type domain-containing protein n=1 Tax=Bremia lactucae TaxID=4779 RepID=A0A976IDB8_BRELC|nr:hypothetical protein CCR75_005946 [Bremia lactucae]